MKEEPVVLANRLWPKRDISLVSRACSSYHDFCASAPAEITTMSQKAESGFLPRMDSYWTNKFLVYSALAVNAWECDDIFQKLEWSG